ncbi:hypothetical protein QJS10_CPA16g01715 [Acorus calamus]|uniref:Uncharacterized protein n=1 Tax=Acorus calamus TaxID=4465 RepID=A0AAV9CXQ3_ACOCL|nr:hypothetical protein QJS10_CPA16g01715 [Acorus calamus]
MNEHRGRGRPPKQKPTGLPLTVLPNQVVAAPGTIPEAPPSMGPSIQKRPPGRPPKHPKGDSLRVVAPRAYKRTPGRPPRFAVSAAPALNRSTDPSTAAVAALKVKAAELEKAAESLRREASRVREKAAEYEAVASVFGLKSPSSAAVAGGSGRRRGRPVKHTVEVLSL